MCPASSFEIRHSWDGAPRPLSGALQIRSHQAGWSVEIVAPFHDDPPPRSPLGSTLGLWNHEVIELFIVGSDQHYLELEFGPHGHHLALELHGVRRVLRMGMPMAFTSRISGERWMGAAFIPAAWVPPAQVHGVNAFAIHGVGGHREHLAWHPLPGSEPDFHQINRFPRAVLPRPRRPPR